MNMLYAFLARDYSGLLIALLLLAIAVVGLRRRPRGARALALRALGLVAIVLAAGAISHLVRVAAIDARYPAPGIMVDVAGQRMHVLAEGPRGGPAIVWLPGGHVGAWVHIDFHKALRGEARSILVDRFGTGWSDAGPFPRTTAREADEVIEALTRAGEPGPFIFAGHSFGGLLAANIARRHPDKTAAVVLLDPTPPDVLLYGLDLKTLASIGRMDLVKGLRGIFGLYWRKPVDGAAPAGQGTSLESVNPFDVVLSVETHSRAGFAGASIYRELTPAGFAERAFETVVYDGDLGNLPLYLVAPGEDASTAPYAKSVAVETPQAERFAAFLTRARERFLAASSNSTRIYAPAGTGHNFPGEAPQFVIDTLRRVLKDVSAAPGSAGVSE